jgi:hypothetical protein
LLCYCFRNVPMSRPWPAVVAAIQKLHHAWGHAHRGNRFDLLHRSKEAMALGRALPSAGSTSERFESVGQCRAILEVIVVRPRSFGRVNQKKDDHVAVTGADENYFTGLNFCTRRPQFVSAT